MDVLSNGETRIELDFPDWLANRLKQLNTDDAVMCPYITSILEAEDDPEETVEALDGILGELGTSVAEELRDEILSKWTIFLKSQTTLSPQVEVTETESDQLSEIIRKATEAIGVSDSHKNLEDDPKLRAAILSIANGADVEDDDDAAATSGPTRKKHDTDSDLAANFGRNTNAEKVLNEQRELKEKARAESAKKKERDKDDRAKQKVAAQERKDKAKKKATKVERKR